MSSARLAERIRGSRSLLVFTGAGVSTGSGIPDFRGPKGLWKTRFRPVYYSDFMASHEARVRHWDFKLQTWKEFKDARPNRGHEAIRELDRMGYLSALVTQNIDGLHEVAGHDRSKIIELHGTNLKIECCGCGRLYEDADRFYRDFERTRQPPLCGCGQSGFLKSATVSFGQSMPAEKVKAAFEAAHGSDLVLSVGSTLEVEPAASVPIAAKQAGAYYAIVNMGPTAHDGVADLRLEGDASALLSETVEFLRSGNAERL